MDKSFAGQAKLSRTGTADDGRAQEWRRVIFLSNSRSAARIGSGTTAPLARGTGRNGIPEVEVTQSSNDCRDSAAAASRSQVRSRGAMRADPVASARPLT